MEGQHPDGPSRRLDVRAAARERAPARGCDAHRHPGCCRAVPAFCAAASPSPTISVCPPGQPIIRVAGLASVLSLVFGPGSRLATRTFPPSCLETRKDPSVLTRKSLLTSAAAVLALSLATPAFAQPDAPIPVVATFSILGDMVKRIGGGHVVVTTLVGPDGDTHAYQPTPADARAISEAQILVVNGLQFEGWLDRLIDASDFRGVRVVATDGIEPIAYEPDTDIHARHGQADHDRHAEGDDHEDHAEGGHDTHAEADHDSHAEGGDHDTHAEGDDHEGHDHGAFDPHAWQSLRNAADYVDSITVALAKADPGNADVFYRNREAYVEELAALDSEISRIVARLPARNRTIVTSHDALQYFGRDYGLTFIAPQGLSTESEASAQDVARLIQQIRERGIRAVFIENVGDPRLLQRIAEETGAVIGGTLYPDALSGPDGPAPTYLDMMRHNATTLARALAS